jgi:hypothetical protein
MVGKIPTLELLQNIKTICTPTDHTNPNGNLKDTRTELQKRTGEFLTSLPGKSLVLQARVNGSPLEAIIDTGATISVVSKIFVASTSFSSAQSIPVEV